MGGWVGVFVEGGWCCGPLVSRPRLCTLPIPVAPFARPCPTMPLSPLVPSSPPGIVGSIPWVALTWLTTWLQVSARCSCCVRVCAAGAPAAGMAARGGSQRSTCAAGPLFCPPPSQLVGFADFSAAALVATFSLGCALGGLLGERSPGARCCCSARCCRLLLPPTAAARRLSNGCPGVHAPAHVRPAPLSLCRRHAGRPNGPALPQHAQRACLNESDQRAGRPAPLFPAAQRWV